MRILYLTHNITWKGGGAFFHAYHQARRFSTPTTRRAIWCAAAIR